MKQDTNPQQETIPIIEGRFPTTPLETKIKKKHSVNKSNKRTDKDYATGKPIDLNKPEEPVRQDTEKWLVEELGYKKSRLDIEHRIRAGSRKLKPDITVFRKNRESDLNQHRDILGLVETKSKSIPEAEEQLHSYMAVCSSCEWGVAATADARQFYRRMPNGDIERIHAIPPHGVSVDQSIRLRKSDLIPAVNLKLRFKSILYHLYSNTNIQSRTRLCNEMTKILFCKIYDEKLPSDVPHFQVFPDKSRTEIKQDIENRLWKPVLIDLETTGIFLPNEGIILDPDSVAYVIGELERLNLSETDCDVIGAAFEVFAERYFVGEKGEFFTPRIAIKNAVKMLNPQYSNTIIDPACGSGGFLIYALEHVWETIQTSSLNREEARRRSPSFIYGIDKEPDLVKVARAYMTLIGDGSTSIVDTDSLKPFDTWNEKARVMLADESGEMQKFNFVFTNPPFGADIKIKHRNVLKKYDLGHKWLKPKNSSRWRKTEDTEPTDPQILFLELCVNLLNEGGRMCIVLPEGVLGNVGQEYVRQWLLDNTTILAVWDCPALLFQPHTNTKTCILFIEKSKTANQSIMMSTISRCGHDARGAEIRSEKGELIEDFSKALTDWQNRPSENHMNLKEWRGEVSIIVPSNDIIGKRLLVPRIYQLEHELGPVTKHLGDLEQENIISIKTVSCGVKQSEYDNENGEYRYVRTTDLGVMELRDSVHNVPLGIYEREREVQDIRPLDILIVKDGTYRIGEPVILLEDDLNIVLQGHFYKIRVLNDELLDPYFLVYALKKSQPFIVASSTVQATISSITIDRMREIPIPYPSINERMLISNEMREILEQRKVNRQKLDKL